MGGQRCYPGRHAARLRDDPVEGLLPDKDTTLALIGAAAARGHDNFHALPRDLFVHGGEVFARVRPVVLGPPGSAAPCRLGNASEVPLSDVVCGLHPQGPPLRRGVPLHDPHPRATARPHAAHQRPARSARRQREALRAPLSAYSPARSSRRTARESSPSWRRSGAPPWSSRSTGRGAPEW